MAKYKSAYEDRVKKQKEHESYNIISKFQEFQAVGDPPPPLIFKLLWELSILPFKPQSKYKRCFDEKQSVPRKRAM